MSSGGEKLAKKELPFCQPANLAAGKIFRQKVKSICLFARSLRSQMWVALSPEFLGPPIPVGLGAGKWSWAGCRKRHTELILGRYNRVAVDWWRHVTDEVSI
jgi:hypothetical protein